MAQCGPKRDNIQESKINLLLHEISSGQYTEKNIYNVNKVHQNYIFVNLTLIHVGSRGYVPVVKTSTAYGREKQGNLKRTKTNNEFIFYLNL